MTDYDTNLTEDVKRLRKELKDCVNELCLSCGAYRNEHHGYCDSCRWLKIKRELAEKRSETQ